MVARLAKAVVRFVAIAVDEFEDSEMASEPEESLACADCSLVSEFVTSEGDAEVDAKPVAPFTGAEDSFVAVDEDAVLELVEPVALVDVVVGVEESDATESPLVDSVTVGVLAIAGTSTVGVGLAAGSADDSVGIWFTEIGFFLSSASGISEEGIGMANNAA